MAKDHHSLQIEAPLPADRVIPQKPFGVTGIDFAGPLYIKVGRNMRKCYIALFTCAVLFIWNYALICPTTIFCWLSNDSWGDGDYQKPFTRTTLKPFMPPTNT